MHNWVLLSLGVASLIGTFIAYINIRKTTATRTRVSGQSLVRIYSRFIIEYIILLLLIALCIVPLMILFF